MASRDITTFPFSQTQKTKLLKAGFRYVADIKDIGPVELSKELNISKEEALQILKIIKKDDLLDVNSTIPNSNSTPSSTANTPNTSPLEGKSAFELLQKEESRSAILTFSQTIDNMLGGGVPIAKLTEFCGVPGIGKTQMGIQLAVDVQIPKLFDGVEGQCIYIDTEGSFVIERVVEIADAMIEHVRGLAKTEEDNIVANNLTLESVLSNIIYYRIHDYVEQIALVNVLPKVLREHKNVKLIILDSVTFHFRHDFEDMGLRTRLLNSLAQNLMALAESKGIAVVLMNQMTTKVGGENESFLVPALGESWGHNCTNRIILYWKDGQRYAYLYKSPSRKAEVVPYVVTTDGIR